MSYRVSTPDGTTFAFDTKAEADAREAEIRRGSDRAQVVTWRDGYNSAALCGPVSDSEGDSVPEATEVLEGPQIETREIA